MSAPTRLELQTCASCGHVQYPNRELCAQCLSDEITPQIVDDRGRLLSWTDIHANLEPVFQTRAPWRIGGVKMACGPVVIAHLAGGELRIGTTVEVARIEDPAGRSVLVAYPADGPVPMALFGSMDT